MIKSKHNIVSKVAGSENYFVVNLLSGNADLLTREEADVLSLKDPALDENPQLVGDLIQNGYITTSESENKIYRNRYFDFVDQRDDEEVQLFFVPN